MKLRKIDHICVAVKDVAAAEQSYSAAFGIRPEERYTDPAEKVNVVRYRIGEVAFEIMESTDPTGEVAKYIDKYGEGLYLISLGVENLEDGMRELRDKGYPPLDTAPRTWREHKLTFLHPKQFNGVLLELFD